MSMAKSMSRYEPRSVAASNPSAAMLAALWVAGSLCGAVLVGGLAPPAAAQEAIEGRWSGPGTMILPSGASERARCRASFRRGVGRSFNMDAVCATASVRVAQTARVQRIAPNRFTGEFINSQYNITGIINLTLSGKRLLAALRGGGGTAYFTLNR